jgi:Rhodanese-like domain
VLINPRWRQHIQNFLTILIKSLMMNGEQQVRGKVGLGVESVFFGLISYLSVACTTSAPPPVQLGQSPITTPTVSQELKAPSTGHNHADHELENRMPRITARELQRLLAAKQAVVIDVRSSEEFRRGHIQGAINLPIQQIESGRYPELPQDRSLISYCT